MPADAIVRVERMAESKSLNALVFGDRHNQPEADEDAAEVQSISSDSSADDDNEDDAPAAHGGDTPEETDFDQHHFDSQANIDQQGEEQLDDDASLPPPRTPASRPVVVKPEPTVAAPTSPVSYTHLTLPTILLV